MNLLSKYIPEYSGHVKSIEYLEDNKVLEVIFFDKPEGFKPVLCLRFTEVSEISVDNYDLDENCIELVIGLDLFQNGYCLHTDQREFIFKAKSIESRSIAT
ncbi:hypothetical protein ACMZOO_00935 [Catenovulum sp. SX2]|uniref:hypothetical protein n=1 Tax=Catenovulum sp. SX2 TaxID=3398614 RepID=UPI003F87E407